MNARHTLAALATLLAATLPVHAAPTTLNVDCGGLARIAKPFGPCGNGAIIVPQGGVSGDPTVVPIDPGQTFRLTFRGLSVRQVRAATRTLSFVVPAFGKTSTVGLSAMFPARAAALNRVRGRTASCTLDQLGTPAPASVTYICRVQ
ncbi:hypothetical protein [Deinococcus maricopensis]|uniref:Uncharacterized protein n=1 Tax=Deinococcus maricopensis (strain DSM 21211 / LMG 22137 / NRRL B-23946 / LB-34) TaxID=709986 RepID=E8UBB7_DEIML|nr:hypothetical protein [Deinococcus maricopensis]ADV68356.1 hypothetical protein Deima_2726 [Deinococcus maricopensis DSM 21211]